LLPPAHPHRRRCRIYVSAVIAAYRSANFFLPTPLHCFYRPIYLRPPLCVCRSTVTNCMSLTSSPCWTIM
jgi:hypothetical protein